MRFLAALNVITFSIAFLILVALHTPSLAKDSENSTKLITSISISKDFFNPTLGQSVQISFNLTHSGLLTVKLLDRDGYIIRSLVSSKPTNKGAASFSWNGGSDEGRIVPDEAYSLWISLNVGSQNEAYFPANSIMAETKAELGYYDRKRAVISYKLPKASRVHLQGGVAVVDKAINKVEGPIMATVVNREPRTSGWIIESWDGFAESDSRIYIPDLPNFKLAVASTALPENSIMTVGNRKQTFLEYTATRKRKSLLTHNVDHHHHHRGLNSLEDISPTLSLHPENADWSEKEQTWLLSNPNLKLRGKLNGRTVETFSKLPGHLMLFVDGREIKKIETPCAENFNVEIPAIRLGSGAHILSANCTSAYGPAAAFSLRIRKQDSISKNSMKAQHETEN